ncbi:aspartic peptidase, partial [Tanacetum coccineum]
LREEEAVYVQAFTEAKLVEERFLKQKAKIEWLDVADTFVLHYKDFLGISMACDVLNTDGLFIKHISAGSRDQMVQIVTNEEIKAAMFSIGDDRAPGPDGFSSAFFKKSWDIVGNDICRAIRDFFVNGKLLKEINHTFLALIPKVSTPLRVTDYRPISCCNVLYKCISKILTNRIIDGIKEVISDNQSAFIPGRRISDNILITQELMHNYDRDRGPPRCAFKVDIQKAYDTVNWGFLRNILKCFGFHMTMVKWIMACVSSASFSLSINGDIHGFFQARRGLRQGDLYYLITIHRTSFTCYGKFLTLIIKRRISGADTFRYHNLCEDLQIVNVCFADDLFIFARGEVDSARLIMDSLDEFQKSSGLVPKGDLPVKYLGVPLISTRLHIRDCKILVERVTNRIGDWKNKSLSFAGRLQLWASVLVIPKSIILDIQHQIRGFLWCNGELKRGKLKVAWDILCLPKCEGGLGIRSLESFNIALMTTHIWNIVTNNESLWPDSHAYLFFECSFPSSIWMAIRHLAGIEMVASNFQDIVSYLLPSFHRRTTKSITGRLLVAAATYFI